MCVVYGFTCGMVANGALILNFFFTLGILSSFQAALTMSGIAGMVLSLGIAVDANVLIYERAKEETVAGKGTRQALSDGYKHVDRSTLWRWAKTGYLIPAEVGGKRLYKQSDIDIILNK